MKMSAGLARLRALCNAGLNGEMFIPAALEALHAIVPSYRNLFDWCDEAGNLVRYWYEGPVDARIAALYFEQFYNRREAEVMPQFRHAVRHPGVVRPAEELSTMAFFRSALYNEIWRPQGLHTRLEALVRTAQGRTLGSLVLYRAQGDPRFTPDDERLLERATAYIAMGLQAGDCAIAPVHFCDTPSARASLVIDVQGRLANASAHAMKLLLLSDGGVTPEAVARKPRREDFAALNTLWQEPRDEHRKTVVQNAWGRFVFEADTLWPVDGGGPAELQVSIAQHEPKPISVRRALDGLPLSPAQREVCALLHQGDSQAKIARQLRVAPTTVADHVRKIYSKLDIHNVGELNSMLSLRP
jgi:DNA-binding CsgD family transcriptional regulator